MRVHATTQEDRPASVTPRAPWRVAEVNALPDFRLRVRFNDGLTGIVDLRNAIHSPRAGVFASLAEPAEFARVRVETGAVTWENGLDLAPDAMHAEIRAHGSWII